MDPAQNNAVYNIASVVCTRNRSQLLQGVCAFSYLEAVEALQNKLAQSVISKLVDSQGDYTPSSALCSVLDLTFLMPLQQST
jgi:hypothetical protein